MHFIDLSHALRDGLPGFPGDPPLSISPHFTIATNRCNVSRLAMGSHQGTHLDAMFHFIGEGKTIEEMPLDWFYGPARIIRIPKKAGADITVDDLRPHEEIALQPGARVVLATGWEHQFGTERYFTEFPSLTQDAAKYLASRKLRMLGMDLPTPGRDYYELHHILLAHDVEMVIVESLANLDALPDAPFTFIGFPLKFAGGDGSPIRAVAMVE